MEQMRMGRSALLLAGLAIVAVASAGCDSDPPAAPAATGGSAGELVTTGLEPDTVQLALNWFPEAEHGGFYAAQVHGLYAAAGLEVTILPGGPAAPVVQQVARGDVEFGVTNADNVLFGRAQQAPIVAVFAPLQDSPRCILVHESCGIESLEQLRDVTLAMSSGAAFAQFLQHRLPLVGVTVVPYSGDVAPFLLDERFACQGYVFSEPFVARQQGGDPRVLMVSELGFNPYTSVLIASEETIRERPDLVRRMVQASRAGWQRYLESPAETNREIHQLNAKMELDVLEFGAEALRPLVLGDDDDPAAIGRMTRERWQALHDQLVESGQLEPGTDAAAAFTAEFLER
jgi:NitT/TauT family transport system substrate-binding protein